VPTAPVTIFSVLMPQRVRMRTPPPKSRSRVASWISSAQRTALAACSGSEPVALKVTSIASPWNWVIAPP